LNLVDSSGWIEYFVDGPKAKFFAAAIDDTNHLLVPTICLFEVFKKVLRDQGESEALHVTMQMEEGQVIDLDRSLALRAARLSFSTKLPMADSIILATSQAFGATIWTLDADFAKIKGVKYTPKS
jgi:toxin FitB